MTISSNVQKRMSEGSWIRKMFEEGVALRQRYGEDNVFDLSLGNPVMEPPQEFKRELTKLVLNPMPGMHRYMENAGYPETRAAVAAQLSLDTGLKFTASEIIMTCGAAGALNVVLKTILDPGDEVIVFAPYFPEYINYIDNHGGIAKVLPTDENFLPRLDVVEASITAKTKGMIINSPNNPTGVVYTERVVREIANLLEKKSAVYRKEFFLISDEPYRKLVYDGAKCPSIFAYYRNSIVVTSYSKDLAIPGERIGYIAVHPESEGKTELVAGFVFCNRVLGFVNAPALMQRVVRYLQNVTVSVAEYQRKRDFLYQHLLGMGYQVTKPQGAFYMFPRSPLEDDVAFVARLQNWQVLTVPGRGFGAPGYFRISYCVEDKTLEGALVGFRKAAQEFGLAGKAKDLS